MLPPAKFRGRYVRPKTILAATMAVGSLLARIMHEGWRVWRKPLIGRKIRLFKLNLPIIGGDTRHG